MKKFIILVLSICVIVAMGTARIMPTVTCVAEGSGTVSITATGKIKAYPDVAYISLSIETKDAELEKAQAENAERANNLIQILLDENIKEESIKTTGFYIFPEYSYKSDSPALLGYKVCHQMKIKISEIDKLGSVIDTAVKNGANVITGIEYAIENIMPTYNQALENALNIAKEKIAVFGGFMNIENIRIKSIKELPCNNYYAECGNISFTKFSDAAAYSETHMIPGNLEIFANIELICEIVD